MPYMMNGYQWVEKNWKRTDPFDLLALNGPLKANNQIYNNGIHAYFHRKISNTWIRARLYENNNLYWERLNGDVNPRWSFIDSEDLFLLPAKSDELNIKNDLIESSRQSIPGRENLEKSSQDKILKALVDMFDDDRSACILFLKKHSVYEISILNDLLNALRLNLPLTDWQTKMWSAFEKIVKNGDNPSQVLAGSIKNFKALNKNIQIEILISNIENYINVLLNPNHTPTYLVSEMVGMPSLESVLLSLPEEQQDILWEKIHQNNEAKAVAWLNFSTNQLLKFFLAFYVASSKEKWIERLRVDGLQDLLRYLIIQTPIDKGFSAYLNLISDFDLQKQALLRKFAGNGLDKITVIHLLTSIKAHCDQKVFEAVMFDENIMCMLQKDQTHFLIKHHLDSKQILRLISNPVIFTKSIQSPEDIFETLKKLDDEDQLKFLSWQLVPVIYIGTPISRMMAHVNANNRSKLLLTENGNSTLARFFNDFYDVEEIFKQVQDKKHQARILVTFLSQYPAHFFSANEFIEKHSLKSEVLKYINSTEFNHYIIATDYHHNKEGYDLGFSYFMITNTPMSSPEKRARFDILKNSKLVVVWICKILQTIDPPLRKEFILSDNIVNFLSKKSTYGNETFSSLIQASFSPGSIFSKAELQRLSRCFTEPNKDRNFIRAYANASDYSAFIDEIAPQKHQLEMGNVSHSKKIKM